MSDYIKVIKLKARPGAKAGTEIMFALMRAWTYPKTKNLPINTHLLKALLTEMTKLYE